MTDPRREAILIRRRDQSGFEDKTSEVLDYDAAADFTYITFELASGPRRYKYSARNVLILRDPIRKPLDDNERVSVRGQPVPGTTEVWSFDGPGETWWRVFFSTGGVETYRTCRQDEISVVQAADHATGAHDVLNYWHDVVSHLGLDDPLRRPYENFHDVPQGSVLDLYLRGEALDAAAGDEELTFPFSSNLSQREALKKGLTNRISVIDGPPGTGKTQTILNLVANIIRSPGKTVGIVSFNNAAVENVRDKLAKEGLGHVVADLRRSEVRREFFARQLARNLEVQGRAGGSPVPASPRTDF